MIDSEDDQLSLDTSPDTSGSTPNIVPGDTDNGESEQEKFFRDNNVDLRIVDEGDLARALAYRRVSLVDAERLFGKDTADNVQQYYDMWGYGKIHRTASEPIVTEDLAVDVVSPDQLSLGQDVEAESAEAAEAKAMIGRRQLGKEALEGVFGYYTIKPKERYFDEQGNPPAVVKLMFDEYFRSRLPLDSDSTEEQISEAENQAWKEFVDNYMGADEESVQRRKDLLRSIEQEPGSNDE